MDEGRSECEIAVDCKETEGFKWTKLLEKSDILHQRDFVNFSEDWIMGKKKKKHTQRWFF